MKIKTIELYEYDELTPEAQEKARDWYREGNEYYFLGEYLKERAEELLKDNNISYEDFNVYYSLSCCQGDGCMLEGIFYWDGYTVNVKHRGHYYHGNSKVINITDKEGNYPEDNELENAFNEIYIFICRELESLGYDYIDYENSDENVIETIRINEYTFTKEGKRMS